MPVDDDALEAALLAARAGDGDAMGVLFRTLHPRLLRYLRSQESNAADDLVGEVWLAVARGITTFDGDAHAFRAWVFSIGRRRIADHRRKGIRRNTHSVDHELLNRVMGPDDTEEEVVANVSGMEAAELVVGLLAPDQAEVVLLRVLGGLDAEEVAVIMGRDAGWVRVTQHRALRKLAERLGPRLGAAT